jgi:hypothetical protein
LKFPKKRKKDEVVKAENPNFTQKSGNKRKSEIE